MYQSSHNNNIQFSELAQYTDDKPVYAYDENFYVAFVAAKNCANKLATDKTTRNTFKTIESKIAKNIALDSAESSLIRRWYMKSLEG